MKDIIKKYNIKAKKSLGQNFLVNEIILDEIVNTIDIKGKNIIEVGPGYGALTEKLLIKKPSSLTLIELDSIMIDILKQRVINNELNINNIVFSIEKIDVLEYYTDFESYYVIANIPYYITSPILRHFLYEVKNCPEKMIILMQKDVGDKILGKGKNKSSVLSLFILKKCNVREVIEVAKENFVPAPKVESSVLLFEKHDLYKDVPNDLFLDFIKKGFKEPRKKLEKNLVNSAYSKDLIIETFNKLGIDSNIRGEDLDISTWCELFKLLH